MPTDNWLKAAKATPRDPVAMLLIEDVDAVKQLLSTQSDWQANKSISNLNLDTEPGTAFLVTDGAEDYAGDYAAPTSSVGAYSSLAPLASGLTWTDGNPAANGFVAVDLWTAAAGSVVSTVGATINFRVYPTQVSDQPWMFTPYTLWLCEVYWKIWGSKDGGEYVELLSGVSLPENKTREDYFSSEVDVNIESQTVTVPRGSWSFKIQIYQYRAAYRSGGVSNYADRFFNNVCALFDTHTDTYQVHYVAGGSIQTPTVDFGAIPTVPTRLEFDDLTPAGATLVYTARGSNDGTNWSDLGTVVDGQLVPPWRYYDLTIVFTPSADLLTSPFLYEIRLAGGNDQSIRISSHHDCPVVGALPYILGNLSALTSRIELAKLATGGELSVKLVYNQYISDLIARGGLRNRAISALIGFRGLSEADFEPYFAGKIYDYEISPQKDDPYVTIRCRDIWQQFKTKLPKETSSAVDNSITTTPVTWTATNVIQIMLDAIDYLGVPDRFIDRPTLNAIRDGVRSGTDWQLTRTISDPTEVSDLLSELQEIAGVFLTTTGSGRLTAIVFDATASLSAIFDAELFQVKKIESGEKDIKTRQIVYYDPIDPSTTGASENYNKAYILVNANAETDGGEVLEQEYYDSWQMNAAAAIALATRRDGWFARPLARVSATEMPPWYNIVSPGALVGIDNLQFPVVKESWPGLSFRQRFLIMSKTVDPLDGMKLKMEFMQIIREATFTRTTIAYKMDGSLLASAKPRFETLAGRRGIYIEEGTTNLVPAANQNFSGGTASGGSTITLTQNYPQAAWNALNATRIEATAGSSALKYYLPLVNPSASGTAYTVSCWVANNGPTNVVVANNLGQTATIAPGEAKRVSASGTGDGATPVWLAFSTASAGDAMDIVAWRPQAETKAYATSWIPDIRNAETLTIPSAGILAASEGTVEMWCYVDDLVKRLISSGNSARLFNVDRSNFDGSAGIFMAHHPSTANWYFGSASDANIYTTASVADTSETVGWHHFALSWNATAINFYIDGALRGTVATPNLPSGLGAIGIGCVSTDTGHLDSLINNVWLSSIARTAQQIADDSRTGIVIPQPGESLHLITATDNLEIKQVTI